MIVYLISRFEQFSKAARSLRNEVSGLVFFVQSLGLGFSNKGLGVSASLGFYHSPPLL